MSTEPAHDCQAGLWNLVDHLAQGLETHADRDGLQGAARAVFLARGGHAPGTVCPTEPPRESEHVTWCEWPDDECHCPPGWPL